MISFSAIGSCPQKTGEVYFSVKGIFLKFQKFDIYFMAVKRVPLESAWFRPALIRVRYMKSNAQNIKLPNEPIW